MKKIKKMVFGIIFLMLTLVANSQSYQRWIVWGTDHEVTPTEMAEIVAALYNGEIRQNKTYTLSTGVIYKIPQPDAYLDIIEKSVQRSRPSANTPQGVVDALAGAEKMPWGNDFSGKTRNYYYSTKYKKVTYNNNYSGSQSGVGFLWIDSQPTIKCDCGNPLWIIDKPTPIVQTVIKRETGGRNSGVSSQLGSQTKTQNKIIEDDDFVPPLTIYEAATRPIPDEYGDEPTASAPPTFLRKNWPWIVGAVAVIIVESTILLLKKGDASMPVDSKGGPVVN
jgi:hypothetical protein